MFNSHAPYDIIKNDFLSEYDIKNIKIVEDTFENYYNKDYYKKSINFLLDNVDNYFKFFYNFGLTITKRDRLEDNFKTLDNYVKENLNYIYNDFHKLLIIDYLNCFKIKPNSWWDEKVSPKEKNHILRSLYEENKINNNLIFPPSLY